MQRAGPVSGGAFRQRSPHLGWQVPSIILSSASLVLLLAVFSGRLQHLDLSALLLVAVAAALFVVILFHATFLLRARKEHMASDERFQQMANNIQEIFWMIDAVSRNALYANQAFETITGYSFRTLGNPRCYEGLIHPDDRVRVLASLEEATRNGHLHEKFRIVCARGEIRWVSVHGFPVRDEAGRIRRLVGTAQEVTAQQQAEAQVAQNLALAQSAWAEADALRKATLALTQDLRMDCVLDTLLQSLAELIPAESAYVLFLEADARLFVARERSFPNTTVEDSRYPLTLDAASFPLLHRVLTTQQSVLLPDTKRENDWLPFEAAHDDVRSWLCVPLIAAQKTLGLLCLAHSEPNRFTEEHVRRAQLLAIPGSVAIQNARLFECAEIYAAELQKRLEDLHHTQKALEQAEEGRLISEDKFQKVFRSSPIPFSITTYDGGRFLDVNAAFERRYGYSRDEAVGQTVDTLRIWEDPSERLQMMAQLQRGTPIRNAITRLRTKSGEIKLTAYSADRIQFDGQLCIFAVSEDVIAFDTRNSN